MLKEKPDAKTFEDLTEGRDYPNFGQRAIETGGDAPMKWPAQIESCHSSLLEQFSPGTKAATNPKDAIDSDSIN